MTEVRQRVVVVRLSALGDVTLASAVIESLSGCAELALVTRAPYDALYRDDPRLARLIRLDRAHVAATREEIRAFVPDVVLDLQGSTTSRRLTIGLGDGRGARRDAAPRLIRVAKDGLQRRLLARCWPRTTRRILSPTRLGWRPTPVIERYLIAARGVPGARADARPRLVVPARAGATAGASSGPRPVALAPGSAWRNKRWPIERHVEIARRLLERTDRPILVVRGPDDARVREAFAPLVREEARVRDLATDLGELPARLSEASVMVTSDSGPMHVAEAVGTPVIALFGPTTREFGFAPWRSDSILLERAMACRPCHVHGGHRCRFGHRRCLFDITVDDVWDALSAWICAEPDRGAPTSDMPTLTPGE